MSSRQQARLRQARGLEMMAAPPSSSSSSEEEDTLNDEHPPIPAFAALALYQSDSDTNESNKISSEHEIESSNAKSGTMKLSVLGQSDSSSSENEDDLLDKIISEISSNQQNLYENDTDFNVASTTGFLSCDTKNLNVDFEMKKKFGARAAMAAQEMGQELNELNQRGQGRKKKGNLNARFSGRSALGRRRFLFGNPKEDWTRPPSFVGGGMGMDRCRSAPQYLPSCQLEAHGKNAQWFTYKWCDEYRRLEEKYEQVQATADPNNLILMSMQNPHHAHTLLQLGIVFAHTGQMENASGYIKRCLFVLECAMSESFKAALLAGNARLDITDAANTTIFGTLFRHAQMCLMIGCRRTALEISKILLSLDPIGDPMGALLCIDSHALACKENQFILDLAKSELIIGYGPSFLEFDWSARKNSKIENSDTNLKNDSYNVTLCDIPGFGLSIALAHFILGNISEAREQGKKILRKFPSVLEPLLLKSGIANPRTQSHPVNWKNIFVSEHYDQSSFRAANHNALNHLNQIYAIRSGAIWKVEEYMEFLYDCASLALQDNTDKPALEEEMEVLDRAYNPKDSPFLKYMELPVNYFSDTYQLLPADANILDPRLLGPNLANRGRIGVGAALDNQLRHYNDMREFFQARQGGVQTGTLDPNSPLMELLWRSLLPWNTMATPQNPPPGGGL